MPAHVLKCEGCGTYQPFLVHEDKLASEKKAPTERYCHICRRTTNWKMAFPERRGGHDRRTGLNRRTKD